MKRKLFLLLCALLTSVGMWAEATYNQTYTNGVAVAAGENFFLYNIGSKRFLTDGMDYGTHGSADHAGRVITLAAATNGYSIYTKPYSANGSAEKAGFLTLNGYVDTGSNDADWVFTPVEVDGYTNAYTIKNSDTQYLYYETKDGLYQGKMGPFISVGNSTGDAYSYWLIIPMSARQAVGDYTYLLRNGDFNHPWELPMWTNEAEWTNIAGGKKENPCAEIYGKGFDVSQTISATVTNGKYKLYNQAFYNNADGENQTYLYANSNESAIAIFNAHDEGTAANMAGASDAFTAGQYVNFVETVVTDASLKVGIKNATSAGNAWNIMNNFYLEYLGTCLVNDAVALPDGGAMAADTWYSFTPPSAGDYNITATTLGDIVYTTDGTILTKDGGSVTATFGANPVTFSSATYFIKSSSANNFAYEIDSYDLSEQIAAYNTALENANTAKAAAEAAKVNAVDKAALDDAISTYGNIDTSGPQNKAMKDALEAATPELVGATNAVNASLAAYAKAAEVLPTMLNLLETTNVYTAAAYAAYYGDPKAKFDANTLTNEEANALQNPFTKTGWHASTTVDDLMLSTWTIGGEQCKDFDKALYINTWSDEGEKDGSHFVVPFFEYWVGSGSLAANTLVATVTGLKPSTTYSFTVRARVKGSSKIANGITMKVGNGDAVDISAGAQIQSSDMYLGKFTAFGDTDEDGKLTATITVVENSNISWLSFQNVLYTEGEDLTALVEEYHSDLTAAQNDLNDPAYANVTGQERTDLSSTITAYSTIDETSKAALNEAIGALSTATSAFTAAKPGYDAYVEASGIATTLGATGVAAPTTAAEAVASTKELYVNIDAKVKSSYPLDVTANYAGEFTGFTSTSSGQHWSGDGSKSYIDGWGNGTVTSTQDITLPAGRYVLKAVGRAQNANGSNASLSANGTTVNFGKNGDTGKGVDMSGAVNYGDGEFTYEGVGRGWEWRFIPVTLEAQTTITVNFTLDRSWTWGSFCDFTILTEPADADDYAALNAAIKNAESMTLGFKAGQYAPYDNVAALQLLAAAKAINQEEVNAKSVVVNATAALTGATWTANETDEPIVYNGTFALSENNGAPAGWVLSGCENTTIGGQYRPRAFVLQPGDTNYDYLSSFGQGDATRSAFYIRYDDRTAQTAVFTYGETTGYTMPLEAAVYDVNLMVGGWNNGTDKAIKVALVDAEGAEIAAETKVAPTIHEGNNEAVSVSFTAQITEAGNYKLQLTNGTEGQNNALVVSNIAIALNSAAIEWQAQIAAAQALAADDDAVAVGKLRDAIEVATIIIIPTDEEKAALQAAVDQFNLDNANQESDQTARVGKDKESWSVGSGNGSNKGTYQKGDIVLVEHYGESAVGNMIWQDVAVENGNYEVQVYATSHNAWGGDGASLQEDANDVAYVFAKSGDETKKTWITARKNSGMTESEPEVYAINDVAVTNGTLTIGLALDKEKQTEWHTMQIKSLKWITTAKAIYAADKVEMTSVISEANALYENPYKTEGKVEFAAAIAAAEAALASNKLNITEFEAEIGKLNTAIEAFKTANYVALAGTYYVKNAAGKFMAAGHNYGTRGIVNEAGLDLTFTPNNENKVAIDSRVYNGDSKHFLGSNLYMDSDSYAWIVEQTGADTYSISNGTQYISVDVEDNLVMSAEPANWQIINATTLDAERKAAGLAAMEAATEESPVDATFLLVDPNFNRNDHRWEAWTVSEDCTNKNLGGGCDASNGNGCAESYHSTFTISQAIANAPAGKYTLTAQGFYRQEDAVEEDVPVFFIGDKNGAVPVIAGTENDMNEAGKAFTNGDYTIEPIEFTLNEAGELTVGIKGTATHQWVIFDNFRLTYYGPAAPKTDYTDYIINADLSDSESTAWNLAGTKGYHNSGNAVTCGNNAVFDFCQVVQNLPAGQYKLTAKSAYRYSGSEADEYAAIEAGTETKFASLYAKVGTKTFSSLVQNRWDGASDVDYAAGSGSVVVNEKFVPNSTAAVKAWFNADKYVNEVVFNLTADGDVTIGIAKDAQPAAGDFTVIGGWTLTRLGDAQPEYAITVAPAENGNVVADKATAAAGETVKVTATPDEGYMVDYGYYVYNETQYDFESIDMEHNIATFTMPAGPVSVVLAFKQAKVAYQFVPSEWGAGDPGRISPENVVANDVAGTITVDKTGANNVNLNFHTTKRYVLSASQRYFVIKATGLATGDTDSYLWWLNHNNNGSQIVPTAIFVENGETVFAWDAITSGIGGTIGLEETELNGTAEWTTTFGMTLADANVPAVISYIGFQETIPEPVEEEAYEFVPSEWGAGDPGRISPENVVADDDMGTITVTQTGDNNVALLFKTNKLYYVENVDYFVIKAKGVSTEAGASYLWWLNGKNDNGAQFAPTSTATETDGTIILEWKISECGNIGENINPAGKSYLVGGDGWNTTFGLTQADALTPVVISYIGYGTKSATAISAAKSQDAEGALKDGKYFIKGEIIIVKNGKLYKANGQLK